MTRINDIHPLSELRWQLAVILAVVLTPPATAQLRIVSYNTHEGPNPGLETVLQAIGEESFAGFARPIDVLLLQEQTSVSGTTQAIVDLLNGIYGLGAYGRSELNGLPVFSDIRQTLVYNTQTVELLGELRVGNPGTDNQPRSAMRYHLRPVGYDSSADFFVYNSHFKADDGTADQQRRLQEATAIRENADSLGEGAHIIYAGDLNLYRSNEAAFQHFVSAGPGQAFDPVDQVGSWSNNEFFSQWHSQSPCSGGCPSGFTAGGLDDRFDFQLLSDEFLDGEGLSYLPGTYRAFGNNGTAFNQSVTAGSNTYPFTSVTSFSPGQVRSALFTSSDHLPVVADYQLPAVLEVIAGSVPETVSQHEAFSLDLIVRNAANVLVTEGADELDYIVATMGSISGAAMGTLLPLNLGVTHMLALDTSTPGVKMGTITVSSASQAAANPYVEIPISYEVLPADGMQLLFGESFELSPGNGYSLHTPFNDGGFDYFGRFPAPDPSNVHRDDFSGFDGEFAIFGEDHDGEFGPATTTVNIGEIDIRGLISFELFGLFGANGGGANMFESSDGDGIQIFIAVDGGPQTMVGAFAPDQSGVSDLFFDADLDGVGDGPALGTSLTEHSFLFDARGELMEVIVALTSTASDEHLAIDNLRLIGRGQPGDYNLDGLVNAADYIVWRNKFGGSFVLRNQNPNATTPSIVDQEDYDFWVAQFVGAGGGSGLSVPEPAAGFMLWAAILLGVTSHRQQRLSTADRAR